MVSFLVCFIAYDASRGFRVKIMAKLRNNTSKINNLPDNLESEKPPVRDYNQVTFLILNFYDDTVIQGQILPDKN